MNTYSVRLTVIAPNQYLYSISGRRFRATGEVCFFARGERDPTTNSRWFYFVRTGELSETTEALIRMFLEAKTATGYEFPNLGAEGHDCLQFSL
jgi:hypothetical protein